VINPSDTPPAVSSKAARSPEELFPLVDLCRVGKLKEVGEWIAAGKPLDPPLNAKRSRRQSPLEVAIEKGFFALAELLLDGGCDPLANGNALCDAVRRKEPEIAKLLIERGVPADSVHLSEVFDAGREMLELFLAYGIDPTAELAYYEALCSKVHPLLFVLKGFKDRFPDLQRQADMALSYHCEKGSPRNVGLLLWAGARPDAPVPDPNYIGDESTSCAIGVAVRQGRVDVLKQLKPQNYPDVLSTLFAEVGIRPSVPLIDYLASLGAPVNTKKNGGCEAIEHLLWRMGFRSRSDCYSNPTEVKESLAMIEHLCRLGAKWVPDEDESLRNRRDRFRKIEPQHLLELFRIFKETNAAPVELLDSILDSPALKKSLGSHLRSIEKLLHPPPPKTDDAAGSATQAEIKNKPDPPTAAEMRKRAEELLLDVVRQEPALHFTRDAASSHHDAKPLRKKLGMPKDDDRDVQPIVNQASQGLNGRLRSFQTQVEWWGRANCRVTATLNKDAEWSDALKEAWSFSEKPNDSLLTDVALDLRELILSGDLGSDWVPERTITYKIGLYGRVQVLSPYLQELENKTDLPFKWEAKERRWPDLPEYRITITDQVEPRLIATGINPKIEARFDDSRKPDLDAVQRLVYDELLKAEPEGDAPFFLLSISTRHALSKCLPNLKSGGTAARFFLDLHIHDSLTRHFDFRDNAKWWFVAFRPKQNWTATLAAIRNEVSRPGLAERYGISTDAAKLLAWVEGLPADRFTGPWTPIVEETVDKWIGISCPWSAENFPAYLQMLLDEINRRTEYDLALQPWQQHGKLKSRIRVSRTQSDLDDLVKRVQWAALQRGSTLDANLAREKIEHLIAPQE
jgi:hypothetical protein